MKQIFTAALITLFFSSQAQDNARVIGPGDVNNDPDWVWYQKYPKGLDMYFFNANSQISKVGPGIKHHSLPLEML